MKIEDTVTGQQEENNSIPTAAVEWFSFMRSQSGEFDALGTAERQTRLVERYLYSKEPAPLDSGIRQGYAGSPLDNQLPLDNQP
jgi:hypothetical protein